jgi:hypothetical protein
MSLVLIRLLPYLLCIFVSGYGAWNYQANHYGLLIMTMRLDYATASAKAARESMDKFIDMQKRKDDAIKSAENRAAVNRAAAVSAAAVSSGLRDDLAAARDRLAASTCSSITGYASTVSTVLDSCQAEYRDMAAKADGHATDAKTLIDAWPQ